MLRHCLFLFGYRPDQSYPFCRTRFNYICEKEKNMGKLRDRMIEDMKLHGYAERTQESYADAVRSLAKYHKRPPDQLSEADIRGFFLHLVNEKKVARSTLTIHLSGIKFFFERTLEREWKIFDLVRPRRAENSRWCCLRGKSSGFYHWSVNQRFACSS